MVDRDEALVGRERRDDRAKRQVTIRDVECQRASRGETPRAPRKLSAIPAFVFERKVTAREFPVRLIAFRTAIGSHRPP